MIRVSSWTSSIVASSPACRLLGNRPDGLVPQADTAGNEGRKARLRHCLRLSRWAHFGLAVRPASTLRNPVQVATFLVCHGAWSSAWAWKKMRPLLRRAGHELIVPTLTGLGERSHLASRDVDLELHIQDVLQVIEFDDLSEIALVGHSYGGMVATGVADRASDRIRHLVYVDAFVPSHGQSLSDLLPRAEREARRAAVAERGDGWKVPPTPIPPDTAAEDVAWMMPRRRPQPVGTFDQPLMLASTVGPPPRTYIYCTRVPPGDRFGRFAKAAKDDPGWRYVELDASHNPHITAPEALARIFEDCVR